MSTNVVSAKDIKRDWVHFDVKDKILGRVATEIAKTLMGKTKPNYIPYLDLGDYVVVTNASQIKVSGKKYTQKVYFRHSGYPGGDKKETFDKLINRRPQEVIRHAISGMLPKNRLGKKMIKKLYIYPGEENPHIRKIELGSKPPDATLDNGRLKEDLSNAK